MEIGERIKKRRTEIGLTLEDVAKKAKVSRQTIQRYESGVIKNIPSDKIELVALALDVTPAYLMGYDPEGMMQRTAARIADLKEQLKNATDETEIADLEYAISVCEESYEDIKFTNMLTFNHEISRSEHLKNNAMKKFGDIFENITDKENLFDLSEDEEQLITAFRKLDPILRKYILFSVINASQFSDITLELDRIEKEYRTSCTQRKPDKKINIK